MLMHVNVLAELALSKVDCAVELRARRSADQPP